MPIDLDRFEALKEKVQEAADDYQQAQGAARQVLTRLQDEFGCETIEAAEEKLAKLRKDEAKADKAFNKALAKFEAEWGDSLLGDDDAD